jgi:hypothetical protein
MFRIGNIVGLRPSAKDGHPASKPLAHPIHSRIQEKKERSFTPFRMTTGGVRDDNSTVRGEARAKVIENTDGSYRSFDGCKIGRRCYNFRWFSGRAISP